MPNAIAEVIGTDLEHGYHHPATQEPSSSPQSGSVARIKLSFNIVAESYTTLASYVDGDIGDKAIISVDNSEQKEDVRRGLYTNLHHYLSALYSYNEQVRLLINECVSSSSQITKRELSPRQGDSSPSSYVKQLAYLLGLRHGLQHGAYQFLNFQEVGDYNDGDFTFHRLKFMNNNFENSSVDNPNNYLTFLSDISNDPQYPLCYIDKFNSEFTSFHTDLDDWIKQSN